MIRVSLLLCFAFACSVLRASDETLRMRYVCVYGLLENTIMCVFFAKVFLGYFGFIFVILVNLDF